MATSSPGSTVRPSRMLPIAVAALALCAVGLAPFQDAQDAKIAPDTDKKIRRLLALTNAGDIGKQAMDNMLVVFREMPGLPDGFIAKFQEIAKPEDLVELIVPIYAKHIDGKTLDAVIAFYESPAGKTFADVQPKLLSESMAAGQKWGEELAKRAMAALDGKK